MAATEAGTTKRTNRTNRTSEPIVNRQAIVQLRVRYGWSQAETSRRAGVSQGHLSEIERGLTYPRPSTLNKLAQVFGVDPREFVVDELAPLIDTVSSHLATGATLTCRSQAALRRLLPLLRATAEQQQRR